MLDANEIGFQMLRTCFYQKPAVAGDRAEMLTSNISRA